MELQGRDLSVNMTGSDVQLLQRELQQLGFTILRAEINGKRFGKTTRRAVMQFQQQHALHATGVVNQQTARLINAEVEAGQPERFVVRGHVRIEDGRPLPKVVVRAFDKDLRSEQPLGESATDQSGEYEITYTTDQFRRAEKKSADLVVRASSGAGFSLAESKVLFNVPAVATVDLVVVPRKEPRISEFEHLVADLTPVLANVLLADLTEADVAFLVGDTKIDRQRLLFLVQAAGLSRETNVLTEVFYGFARKGLTLELESLLNRPREVLRNALEAAIAENIIPARLRDSLDEIIKGLEELRFETGLDETFEFFGRLRDEKTERPLVGFTVRAFDLDAPDPTVLGHDIANAEGLFLITYTAPRPPQPEEGEEPQVVTRRLRLHIVDPQGEEIHQAEIRAKAGVDEVTEIRVPVPEVPDTSATVTEIAGTTEEFPAELLSHLAENNIRTLDDIRKRGGLSRLDGLPVAADHEAVRRLEAHAKLSLLSRDVGFNARLIDSGFTSVADAARVPRSSFVRDSYAPGGLQCGPAAY